MTNRRLIAGALTLVLAAATACSSNTGGHGSNGDSPGSQQAGSSSSPGNTSTVALPANITPAQLAGALASAAGTIKSAHISLDASFAGQSLTGTGDEKLSGGKLQAMRLTETLPGGAGSLAIVVVGTKAWIKLPSALQKGGKPWVAITADSSNATVRQLATTLGSTLQSASIASAGQFAKAATSVKVEGKQQIDGTQATHVHVTVDPTKVASTVPGGTSALQSAGLHSLPVDLYLDDKNRPVEVSTSFAAAGQRIVEKIDITDYDQPVSISAPPAGEIGPG